MSKFLFDPMFLWAEGNVACVLLALAPKLFGLNTQIGIEASYSYWTRYILAWVLANVLAGIGYFSLGIPGWLILTLTGGAPGGDSAWPAAFSMSFWYPWVLPIGVVGHRTIQANTPSHHPIVWTLAFGFLFICIYKVIIVASFQ